jgi:predicted nucleotidyltransferase
VIERITRWAAARKDVLGLLLVGSCARNAARPDSDIDVVRILHDPGDALITLLRACRP